MAPTPTTTSSAPPLVRRPRLEQRLTAAGRGQVALVTAPAGGGKTALLSQWVNRVDGPDALTMVRRPSR